MSGNPKGRPLGSRNKGSEIAQQLMDERSAQITDVVLNLAESGDRFCLKICMDRILRPRRDRCVPIDLPPIRNADDLRQAFGNVFAALSAGEISPYEASLTTQSLEKYGAVIEMASLSQKLEEVRQIVFPKP